MEDQFSLCRRRGRLLIILLFLLALPSTGGAREQEHDAHGNAGARERFVCSETKRWEIPLSKLDDGHTDEPARNAWDWMGRQVYNPVLLERLRRTVSSSDVPLSAGACRRPILLDGTWRACGNEGGAPVWMYSLLPGARRENGERWLEVRRKLCVAESRAHGRGEAPPDRRSTNEPGGLRQPVGGGDEQGWDVVVGLRWGGMEGRVLRTVRSSSLGVSRAALPRRRNGWQGLWCRV